jgi:hypothetical protein
MCELAKLPMVICSESIETVSISGSAKFKEDNNNCPSGLLLTTPLSCYLQRQYKKW